MATSEVTPKGLAYGLGVYLMWGLFPLYFVWLDPGGPLEIIVHRATWGLLFCVIFLACLGKLRQLRLAAEAKVFWPLTLAGLLIIGNWTTYVYAIMNGGTVDAALGYFINPLVTLALAVLVLREKITPLQGVALCLGVLAVVVMVIGMGRLPWISLALALSFALYSLVKKQAGARVPAVAGMVIENLAIVPALLCYLGFLAWRGQTSFQKIAAAPGQYLPWWAHLLLLIGAGVLTATALIIFAKASQNLPLGVLGMMQYISPVMAMFIGVVVFHEPMAPVRWIGTAIIWVALVFLGLDMWLRARRLRRLGA